MLFVATSGCAGSADAAGSDTLAVAANFYPVQFLAERVGGDRVDVTGLTPAGTEPHDLALDGRARGTLQGSDVVLYLGAAFQPDVEAAVASLPREVMTLDLLSADAVTLIPAAADLGKESLSGNNDPHVWLSPVQMSAMSSAVADAFSTADPEHAEEYKDNHAALVGDLEQLDTDFEQGLADCANTTIVTSHAAFGYLADEYGLRQVAIAGLSPDDEPDPKTLGEITEVARDSGVRTVFFEEALPADLATTVANEIGATTSLLAALEFEPEGSADYLSVMRGNLARLVDGLGCQ